MPPPLHFHFDFISPYGFFASREIEALAARHDRGVQWHPMLLGVSVLKVMGLKSLLATPLKGDYVRRDVLRHARRLGLQLKPDMDAPQMNPLPAGRALCWIQATWPALQSATVHAVYAAHWLDGHDLSTTEALLEHVAWPAGIDVAALREALAGEAPAQLLRQSVEASLAAGVFGSPTVVLDGEPFWGYDRMGDVQAWLSRGGW